MNINKKISLLYELKRELSYLEWKRLGLNNLEPLIQEVDKKISTLLEESKARVV